MEENNNTPPVANPETLIFGGTKIEGKILGKTDVRVEGEIEGEVDVENTIIIADEGKSNAEIKAKTIIIEGTQTGNVDGKELIKIAPTGVVKGDLKAPTISIEKGAKFSGKIEMYDSGD